MKPHWITPALAALFAATPCLAQDYRAGPACNPGAAIAGAPALPHPDRWADIASAFMAETKARR